MISRAGKLVAMWSLVAGALLFDGSSIRDVAAAPLSKAEQQKQEQLKNAAPGDMYFGRMKLSFLGINNTFKDAAIAASPYSTDSGITNKVDFGIEALNEWANKYPRDSHLPRSYFLGEEAFKKLWVRQYQDKAWSYMQLLVTKYPTTFFGKTVKTELAKGFTKHYFADALPCGPEPAQTAAPVTSVDPKGFKTEVLTPACVVPASSSPAVHAAPVPATSGSPEPSPAAGTATSSPAAPASPSAAAKS